MKLSTLLLSLFLLLLGSSCKEGEPKIFYDSNVINLGIIELGKVFSGKIVIKNIGDGILKINEINPDCSCTITNIEKKHILPKDSTYIRFDIKPSVGGIFQQNIIVDNNSKNESRILFLVRAKVNVLK
jgi:hypothetical protein